MSILWRITNLFQRSKLDREIEAELRAHIEMRTADNIAAGMPPEKARRDALLRFGNRAVLKERVTAADAHMLLDSLWQDLCYGLRMLRKSPGFTAAARSASYSRARSPLCYFVRSDPKIPQIHNHWQPADRFIQRNPVTQKMRLWWLIVARKP